MNPLISCCGVDCGACEGYPEDCKGCTPLDGKPEWTTYAHIRQCYIYLCCRMEKGLDHCGKCEQMPCKRYFDCADPASSREEQVQSIYFKMKGIAKLT
ncbi:DUF3795 domain-containing protein [Ruminococcaceae bacterium OttesenSCG-928-L11]|nr:DUF3795 domain-containing protein [Ruminococcaceae bacterium OttesenSCG-928-L11]